MIHLILLNIFFKHFNRTTKINILKVGLNSFNKKFIKKQFYLNKKLYNIIWRFLVSLIRPINSNIFIKFCDKIIKNKNGFKMQAVNPCCFRSTQAGVDEFSQIAQKGVKTILNLKTIPKKEAMVLASEAEKYGMKYVNIQLNPYRIKKSLPYILDVIKNSSKENPMLVHCTFGKDRTGFVAALS